MDTEPEHPRPDRAAWWTGWAIITAGIALAVVRIVNTEPLERADPEATAGSLAFGVAVAVPGVLALMARHRRPVLLLPASAALAVFSSLSYALVMLPLLIPATILVLRYRRSGPARQAWWDALLALVLTLGVLGSMAVLFATTDQRTYSSPTTTLSTSVITWQGTALSLALVGAVLVVGWIGAERTPDQDAG